jgi:GTPase SAR1 family protein
MSTLTTLRIGGNRLRGVPDWFVELKKLSKLGLSFCQLTSIPEWISEIPNLKVLDLVGNDLASLPDSLLSLKKLQALILGANSLSKLPDSVSSLRNLRHLSVWCNSLKELPASIGELPNLRILDLAGNQLNTLPRSLSHLGRLTRLDLSNNRFKKIPDAVFDLASLTELLFKNAHSWVVPRRRFTDSSEFLRRGEFVFSNQIEEIPGRIVDLGNLETFECDDEFIKIPPPEVLSEGISGIRNYFQQVQATGVDNLYEAKLLILGEGGAGKTTLARKLVNPECRLNENESSTKGIDVIRWEFELDNDRRFLVNIWDFGGQEIYHSTHQFFLTKRSLYALVADTRKEDTDFFYWLNVVDLLTDGSPLIIVKNEKQDRQREINERQLRAEFGNLKETVATNLASGRSLDKVSSQIKQYISTLPHVGTPLPKTWINVRHALERDPRHYIRLEEYLEICQNNGFAAPNDKFQLMGYLHDLGVCLHFQEDAILRKIVILKPKWGTDAAYRILDNPTVIRNRGHFSRSDLSVMWCDPEYANMHDELLQLMMNFRLCYRIPNSKDSYIAPQLLTEDQPAYGWEVGGNLILRYTYEFMPKGIVTQFIVAMHSMIVEEKCLWKSGVVIEKDQARAEIIEYYGKREIVVRVAGQDKRSLMTVVAYELDRIHSAYKRLKFKKLIPCNCNVCIESPDPHFFVLEVLQRYVSDQQVHIQCQRSYSMVDVRGLVGDIAYVTRWSTNEKTKIVDEDFRRMILFSGPVATVVVNPGGSGDMTQKSRLGEYVPKSPWASGSFYLFSFLAVIIALGVLAGTVSARVLVIVIVAGVLFVPLIGALQLRQDGRLSEKSFVTVIKLVIGQLPLVGRLMRLFQKDGLR